MLNFLKWLKIKILKSKFKIFINLENFCKFQKIYLWRISEISANFYYNFIVKCYIILKQLQILIIDS